MLPMLSRFSGTASSSAITMLYRVSRNCISSTTPTESITPSRVREASCRTSASWPSRKLSAMKPRISSSTARVLTHHLPFEVFYRTPPLTPTFEHPRSTRERPIRPGDHAPVREPWLVQERQRTASTQGERRLMQEGARVDREQWLLVD